MNFAPWRTRFSTIGSTVARGNSGKHVFQPDHARVELSRLRVLGQLRERHGMVERKFPHRRADDFGEVRAGALQLSQIVRERANVRARRRIPR